MPVLNISRVQLVLLPILDKILLLLLLLHQFPALFKIITTIIITTIIYLNN
jgi:hypothetical protein